MSKKKLNNRFAWQYGEQIELIKLKLIRGA